MVLLQCCNTLGNTVKKLCQDAGISGFKTNHSLRVTNATRLSQHGVDKQLIMTRTDHRSVSGVCTYNRVSDDQKETLSSNLNSLSVNVVRFCCIGSSLRSVLSPFMYSIPMGLPTKTIHDMRRAQRRKMMFHQWQAQDKGGRDHDTPGFVLVEG